jgi:hypothetical protein
MNQLVRSATALLWLAPAVFADFKYDQNARMTGGALKSMMQMVGRFGGGAALQNVDSTVSIQGNRMATVTAGKTAQIVDLDKEQFIDVNFEKKEYSVTTFAEMRAFMEKAMQKVGQPAGEVSIDVKETGKSQVIDGLQAREFLLSMKYVTMNPQTGKNGEMQIEVSSWMAPALPGHKEMQDFHVRMARKLNISHLQAGIGRGMQEAAKKLATMDGVAVLQVVRMMPTDPEQAKQMEAAFQQAKAQQGANQPQMPNAKDAAGQAAGQAAAGAVAGRLGRAGGLAGGLGGLGGLRRKKAEEPPPPPPPPAAAAEAPAPVGPQGSFSGEASLIEMTVKTTNFSNSGVTASAFETPGGFKLVKSAMQR